MDEKIVIYTDGSSSVKKDKDGYISGGIGVYFENNPRYNISNGYYEKDATNSKMEVLAMLLGLKKTIDLNYKKIIIYTDSEYLLNSITKWAIQWEKNNWKRKVKRKYVEIKHVKLIKQIYNLYNSYDVKIYHINSHMKEPTDKNTKEWDKWYGNMMADHLAKSAHKRLI